MDIRAAKRIVLAKWPKAYISHFGRETALLAGQDGISIIELASTWDSNLNELWIAAAKTMETSVV